MSESELIGVALPPQRARAIYFQTVVMTLDRDWGDSLAQALRARGVPTLVPPNPARWRRQSGSDEVNSIILDFDHGGPSALELFEDMVAGSALSVLIGAASTPSIRMVVDAVRAGAYDFINKRFELRKVCAQIEAAGEHLLEQQKSHSATLKYRGRIATLSRREREILRDFASGLTTKQIAFNMDISPRTVQVFRDSVRKRLGARSFEEALSLWIQFGEKPLVAAA
jgi:two-component system response regulator FixJ